MQVDIKTSDIQPIRQTFSFIARRFGADKPASRYQEATLDMQPEANFHYRPLWEPELELYDKKRTAIKMADWYSFKDPRHYYYGVYTMARAKQQEGAEKQFEFAEKRNLLGKLNEETRQSLINVLVPLRHYEWGANMNNCYGAAYGYGAAITQACTFSAMDRLGIAQYLTRIGLLIDGNEGSAMVSAKETWLHDADWQELRRVMENLFVTKDWFEVFVAQNLVLDGLIYPLIYQHYDEAMNPRTANALSLVTIFMADWHAENVRWTDATIKTAAEESPENAVQLGAWYGSWREEALRALKPLASKALGANGPAVLATLETQLNSRATKLGLEF
ncbi:MAG: aromatic/alkene monooxygenase hydroxylase subunit beta [Burkholderiales bacterium]